MLFSRDVAKYLDYRKKLGQLLKDDPTIFEIFRVQDVIDRKASALLTHVSIMIATCAFLYEQFKNNKIIGQLVLTEGIIYILASLLLVLCVNFVKIKNIDDEKCIAEQSAEESIFRLNSFKLAYALTIFATVLLLGTIAPGFF
jgi:hypothetical protein